MTEHQAVIAYACENAGKVHIVLGEGDHSAQRWELPEELVRKLMIELFHIATHSWFRR